MSKILVVAPHPDDETLGCGGSLFRHKFEKDEIYWLIISAIKVEDGWSKGLVTKRENEIKEVCKKYEFLDLFNLQLPTTKLDSIPLNKIIKKIGDVFNQIEPELIYMPYLYDVHSDHQIISKALQSTLKWFRYSYVKKVLMYETPSETEFNFADKHSFKPNVFIDISDFIDEKIKVMKIYKDEMGEFPFPRSEKTMRSLASFRGSQSGYQAAEAFELVLERK